MNAIQSTKSPDGKLAYALRIGRHTLITDVPESLGGDDLGPDPHELLDAALTACTALTVTMVARRKNLPLTDVQVEISHAEADGVYRLQRNVRLVGELTQEQRDYLLGIANKCPIHRALQGRFEVTTALVA